MLRYAVAALTLTLLAGAPLNARSYTLASGPLEKSACDESVAQPAPSTKKIFGIDTTPSGRAVPRIVIDRPTASDDNNATVSACHKDTTSGKDQPTRTSTTEVRR